MMNGKGNRRGRGRVWGQDYAESISAQDFRRYFRKFIRKKSAIVTDNNL